MSAILDAAIRALPLVLDRRVLWLVLLPFVGAALLWVVLLLAAWSPIQGTLAALLAKWLALTGFGSALDSVAAFGAGMAAFVLLTLSAGAIALAALAVLAGPVFVRAAESRYFRDLARKRGGTTAGGVANALVTIAVWLPMWLVVLPLWFVPGLGLALSLALSAWLNQRLFRYDALAEHASAVERRQVFARARWRLLGLGLMLAPLALVPVANLVAPIYAGLAFTVLCLAELEALRRQTGEG
jgi:CysZ protein